MELIQLQREGGCPKRDARIRPLLALNEHPFIMVPMHHLEAQLIEQPRCRQVAVAKLPDVDEVALRDASVLRYGGAEIRLPSHVPSRPGEIECVPLTRDIRAADKPGMIEIRSLERAAVLIPDRRGRRRPARYDVDEVVAVRRFIVECIEEPIPL